MTAPKVFECSVCGRVWVNPKTVTRMFAGAIVKGAGPGSYQEVPYEPETDHTGGCIEGEPETWSARCSGVPTQVKPWPELEAAFRLGGKEAAEHMKRKRSARGVKHRPNIRPRVR